MIHLIVPGKISIQLSKMIQAATCNVDTIVIREPHQLPNMKNRKILFAIELNEAGLNIPLLKILSVLHSRGQEALCGSSGAILLHSNSELYTKSTASCIAFKANQMGCSFMGHSLIEATKDLKNFLTWQKKMNISLEDISLKLSKRLGERLLSHEPCKIEKPKIVVLHSSSKKTSNTLALWHMVKKYIPQYAIEELHIENGSVFDCIGCSYKTCKEYSKQGRCYYGGLMVTQIIPAVEKADAVIWICPNYNDAISSNLMAVINRLTNLYRKISFHNKTIFSVIVSGNSGGDSVALQLIDALNINKGFRLPPYFSIMATANDPGSIFKVPDIEKKAHAFAEHIMQEIKA